MPPGDIMLIAGESSGDALGGRLMAALHRHSPQPLRFHGIGGPQMIEQGLESQFPMQELAVMGFAEVLPKVPHLLRRVRELADRAESLQPLALITIDAPSFGLRVTRRLGPQSFPRIQYVAPQVWAWRPGRAKKLGDSIDHLLTLLPFEDAFFAPHGLDSRFVGHPIIETAGRGDGERLRRGLGLNADQRLLLLLPGSRLGEIGRHIDIFLETARLLSAGRPDLALVLPTVEHTAPTVQARVAAAGLPVHVVSGAEQRQDAFAAADAALAASGTVSLELALNGVPAVVAYRTNALTAFIARRLINVSHVAMPNILLQEEAMPEFLQENCRPEPLSAALGTILDEPAKEERADAFARLARLLGSDGAAPSSRAAEAVLSIVETWRSRREAEETT